MYMCIYILLHYQQLKTSLYYPHDTYFLNALSLPVLNGSIVYICMLTPRNERPQHSSYGALFMVLWQPKHTAQRI